MCSSDTSRSQPLKRARRSDPSLEDLPRDVIEVIVSFVSTSSLTPLLFIKYLSPSVRRRYSSEKISERISEKWNTLHCANEAARCGHKNLLRWYINNLGYVVNMTTFAKAAEGGRIRMLSWLQGIVPRSFRASEWTCSPYVCAAAALGGHLSILKWLRCDGKKGSKFPPAGWDETVCSNAARGGHLRVLKWLLHSDRFAWSIDQIQSGPCPWDVDVWTAAAAGNSIEVLRWLHSQPSMVVTYVDQTCSAAVRNGHMEALRWLVEEAGCTPSFCVLRSASQYASLECVKYLLSKFPDLYRSRIYPTVALAGKLDIMKWLWETGRRLEDENEGEQYNDFHLTMIKRVDFEKKVCENAVRGGNLEMLKWLRSIPFEWGVEVVYWAIVDDQLPCLKWILETKPEWGVKACAHAADVNDLKVLKWLKDPDEHYPRGPYEWDAEVCKKAATQGDLEMIKWARGYKGPGGPAPWDSDVYQAAKEVKYYSKVDTEMNTELLRWLRDNGCPQDEN